MCRRWSPCSSRSATGRRSCSPSELYTNLIGRQDPIDAAVAEARKAIYIDLRPTVEWATPVLFMGDVDVELFHFEVARGAAAAHLRLPSW